MLVKDPALLTVTRQDPPAQNDESRPSVVRAIRSVGPEAAPLLS